MEINAPCYESKLSPIDIHSYREILFINHDQLNLSVFPTGIVNRSPLFLFVESYAYSCFLPHHQMKLAFILSCQRHFAIELHQQGYAVLTQVLKNKINMKKRQTKCYHLPYKTK